MFVEAGLGPYLQIADQLVYDFHGNSREELSITFGGGVALGGGVSYTYFPDVETIYDLGDFTCSAAAGIIRTPVGVGMQVSNNGSVGYQGSFAYSFIEDLRGYGAGFVISGEVVNARYDCDRR